MCEVSNVNVPQKVLVLSPQHQLFQDTFLQTLEKSPLCTQLNSERMPVKLEQQWPSDALDEPCIVYNTEQLSRPSILERAIRQIQEESVVQWWDQSSYNIETLKKHIHWKYVSKLHHLPIQCDPEKVSLLHQKWISQKEKSQDFGVIQFETPYRKAFLEKIEEKTGARILRITSFDWESKAESFSHCKALLNIHADPSFQIFESARCTPFLDAGIPVLTEDSYDLDSRCHTVFKVPSAIHKIRLFLAQDGNVGFN